jgi:hypothetical protein
LLLPVSANVMWLFEEGRRVESISRLRSLVIWFVHPLSKIHSVVFGTGSYKKLVAYTSRRHLWR